MGANEVVDPNAPRVPEDLKSLARRAANFESYRPELKTAIVELFRLGTFILRRSSRRILTEALHDEGWRLDDARDFALAVISEVKQLEVKKVEVKPPIGFRGRWQFQYAMDRFQYAVHWRAIKLHDSCRGAPVWLRVPTQFVVIPIVYIVGFVVYLVVGILTLDDRLRPGY